MLKVAIFEKYAPDKPIDVDFQMNMPNNDQYGFHGRVVYQSFLNSLHLAVKGLMTDDEIRQELWIGYMTRTKFSVEYCIKNGISLVNLSSLWMDYIRLENDVLPEYELNKTTLMFAGAGNDGNDPFDHDEGQAASRDTWLGIGAVDSNYVPRSFSSWGNDEVLCCGVDGLIDNRVGTSFASPYVMGIVTAYYLLHNKYLGYYPNKEQTLMWIRLNCRDLEEDNRDLKTGYGVLKIPKHWTFRESVYTLNSNVKTIITYVDGVRSEEIKQTYIPFEIEEGRSKVNPRDIADDLNATTSWNDNKKQAHFSTV